MSGVSDETTCPFCQNMMRIYSNYKPFDYVSGECMYCGFTYHTKARQMSLKEVNELRKEHNEMVDPEQILKPLKQKDLDKYKKDIAKF